jgi:hypothetical protein
VGGDGGKGKTKDINKEIFLGRKDFYFYGAFN